MEWDYQLGKQHQKSPSTIDLLSVKQCQELEVDGVILYCSLFVCAGTLLVLESLFLFVWFAKKEKNKNIPENSLKFSEY